MKTLLFCLVLVAGTLSTNQGFAQTTTTTATEKVNWLNNMSEAIRLSKETGKPIMLFFTGSDWCGWCKRLQGEVFFTKEFVTWVNASVIPVELDFPRSFQLEQAIRDQNVQLQQLFKVAGYPTVVFVNAADPDEKGNINLSELGRTGYLAGGPTTWIANAQTLIKK